MKRLGSTTLSDSLNVLQDKVLLPNVQMYHYFAPMFPIFICSNFYFDGEEEQMNVIIRY